MPGVYISYPFCSQKCTFCNFASGVLPRELEESYLPALQAEIAAHEWQWTPDTVYLGGGTPSRMDLGALDRILDTVPGRPWIEATIEAAPGSITADAAAAWRKAGLNRVSLGVQSFVARELARTGRKHRAETVAADVATLRAAGIANHNIDLIAGLPGQTRESWNESLDWIERLAPAHVSVYMLEVDQDSRLGLEILNNGSRYGASDAPTDDLTVELYEAAVDRLQVMGIERYEISNFARPGFESAHNLKYWRLQPYVGFGADAHSFDGADPVAKCRGCRGLRPPRRCRDSRARGEHLRESRRGAVLRGAPPDARHPARCLRMDALRTAHPAFSRQRPPRIGWRCAAAHARRSPAV